MERKEYFPEILINVGYSIREKEVRENILFLCAFFLSDNLIINIYLIL